MVFVPFNQNIHIFLEIEEVVNLFEFIRERGYPIHGDCGMYKVKGACVHINGSKHLKNDKHLTVLRINNYLSH